MFDMLTPRSVATFTSDVPLGNLLSVNVISDRVAAIARRTSRALHVVSRIILRPPVGAGRRNEVFEPLVSADVTLDRKREVVFTNFGEITLLPDTSIHEGHLIHIDLGNIVVRQVCDDGFRV